MSQPVLPTEHRQAQPGATLTEYAILLGLVGMVSIVGLNALGGSTSSLLNNTDTTLAQKSTLNLLQAAPATVAAAGKTAAPGAANSKPLVLVTDPTTGQMMFQLGSGAQSAATNVTSIDGKTMNTLGSTMLASKLDQLAEQETNPALKDYYTQMAQLSFYLGGAEGTLDNVSGLTLPTSQYNNADALHDVITMSDQLQTLMNNPPANLDQASFNQVMPLAADVFNIANKYKSGLKDFIASDNISTKAFNGQDVPQQPQGFIDTIISSIFGPDTITVPPNSSGNGTPGSALSSNANVPGAVQTAYTSYSNLVDYNKIKTQANQVLASSQVWSVSVQGTLIDAKGIDTQATATGP